MQALAPRDEPDTNGKLDRPRGKDRFPYPEMALHFSIDEDLWPSGRDMEVMTEVLIYILFHVGNLAEYLGWFNELGCLN